MSINTQASGPQMERWDTWAMLTLYYKSALGDIDAPSINYFKNFLQKRRERDMDFL